MSINIQALRRREPANRALARYEEIARLLTGRPQATAEEGVRWVAELCRKLEIPPLRTYGVTPAAPDSLIEKAAGASSMKANPLVLNKDELREILEQAL